MPRHARNTPGGYVYHVLSRAAARLTLFRKAADYDAFLRVLDEALERTPTRLLAYCLMPTHWHFVLWPEHDQRGKGDRPRSFYDNRVSAVAVLGQLVCGFSLRCRCGQEYCPLRGRSARALEDGLVYHVLNRGNGRRAFLHKPGDYEAFLRVRVEAKQRVPLRVLASCLMPTHWHMVLGP